MMFKSLTLKTIIFSLILLFISHKLSANNTTEFPNSTFAIQQTTSAPNPCLVTCEECGFNSKHCEFNPVKCTIKCECKEGFTGETCNTTIDEDFFQLKEKAWIHILNDLNSNEFQVDILSEKINILFENILLEKQFDSSDITRLADVMEKMDKIYLNENSTNNILNSLDSIIQLNYLNRKPIIEANLNQNRSGLRLLGLIDTLPKYFNFKQPRQYFKYSNFEMLYLTSPPMESKFELKSNKTFLIDSINLNEEILLKRYKNNTVKVAFKIYFNYNQVENSSEAETQIKRDQFYKQLNKPRNFIYELVRSEEEEEQRDQEESQKIFSNFFVSSNVLSAVIYKKDNSQIEPDLSDFRIDDKFVRIQFVIDLQKLNLVIIEKNLKCVFWNFTSLKWSANGCFTSYSESGLLKETKFYQKVCYCSHLTNFALLFDPNNQIEDNLNNSIFDRFLTILTYVGVTVSSVCYLVLINLRLGCIRTEKSILFKKPNANYRDGTLRKLYLSNAFCLLISNLMFLLVLLIKPSVNFDLCKIASAFLHYFLLASFCFSLGIAWKHFTKLVKIFQNYSNLNCKFIFKWFIFSLVFPLGFSLYGYFIDKSDLEMVLTDNCWLKAPQIYYLFIAPISFLLVLSLAFYICVTLKVFAIYRILNKVDINLNTQYNNKKVIVILTFSFISLGLTWLIGILIFISNYIDSKFKMAMEFLFCLFNSFHGLSLLIGNILAQKYSNKENESTFVGSTKTTSQNRSETEEVSMPETKINFCMRLFFILYGICFCFSGAFNKRNKNKNQVKPRNKNKKLQKKAKKNKSTSLEFTIVNHEDSDSNNQHLQTIQTHLPIETHIYTEYLPNYFTSVNKEKKSLENNEESSICIEKKACSSSF